MFDRGQGSRIKLKKLRFKPYLFNGFGNLGIRLDDSGRFLTLFLALESRILGNPKKPTKIISVLEPLFPLPPPLPLDTPAVGRL